MSTKAMQRMANTTPARAPTVLVPLIRRELAEGEKQYSGATMHYRAAGKLLLEAKAHPQMRHGEFKPWVAAHFRLSYDSAKSYMRLAKGEHAPSLRAAKRDPSTRDQTHRPRAIDEDKRAIRAMARDLIDAGFRAMAAKVHPDKPGGSVDLMQRLTRSRDVLVQCILDW